MRSWSEIVAKARRRGLALLLGSLVLISAWQAHAQPPAGELAREPELERDEARRLGPAPGTTELNLDQVTLPPAVERKRLSELRETLSPLPEADVQLRVRALEGFIDYDEEDQMIYGPGRTRIQYDRYMLEADKVILDARLKEVQAEGNVVMKIATDTIYATSLRYNFDSGEGVAFGVRGAHAPLYFQASKPKKGEEHIPQMQRLSKQQSIFRNTNLSTCDFKVPHYYVRGREVVLYQDDKVFLRGATLYVMGAPVFYLPFYSRSLREGSPWFMQVGYGSRTGARMRVGYRYRHVVQEPSLTDDEKYETRQSDVADTFVDYMTEVGLGAGMDYKYNWEFGKHRGELNVYGLQQSGDRRVVGDHSSLTSSGKQEVFDDNTERWVVGWKHRTELSERVNLLFNVDEFSDPDIFYDTMDFFSDDADARDRQMTRRARGELSYRNDAFMLRMYGELKDRIGINRYNDFSNSTDNNRDWDLNPYGKIKDKDLDGISSDRWGRVSEKIQLDLATRLLPVGLRPWYYSSELHTYYNLDKGMNIVNDQDDASVPGAEFYQRLMRQWKLSPRYTLIAAIGLGVGATDRDQDMGLNLDGSFPQNVDGMTFVDNDGTFLVGKRRMNYDDINNAYVWGDAMARLNARFTDALTGKLEWRYRKTTSDFMGDWLARTGDYTFREDLYDYKLREHWVESSLDYRLARPLMNIFLRGGYNLEGKSEFYANERVSYANTGYTWANQRQTLVNNGSVGFRQRQIFDPSDPESFIQDKVYVDEGLSYSPIHQRWYARILASYSKVLGQTVERSSSSNYTYFTDEDPDGSIRVTYGRELGPKWNTEIYTDWDQQVSGLKKVSWMLKRDLHDAEAIMRVTVETDDEDADSRNDNSNNQMDVRFGLKFKLPNHEAAFGAGDVRTARDVAREPAIAY